MLGVNLVFAGFALTLNGISYVVPVDNKVKAVSNILVGLVIAVNAIFQTMQAVHALQFGCEVLPAHVYFGFSAAMWMFALNYFIIAAHILLGSENWKAFGLYGLFASIVSLVFAVDTLLADFVLWEMVYMWLMWCVLWLQTFLSILCGIKAIDKLTPHILILNGVASTFVPGLLILLGIIL